jgi:membrane protease YdiL (CAAX protease family)
LALRIPRVLAWLLIAMAMFTAGLLRQFHDLTPASPFLAPAVGSLLFACVLFLLLVAARERQIGAAPGPGIRLGSLTPILLMLLVEKWISSGFYQPLFALAAPADLSDHAADAWFRLTCGFGLLAIVLLTFRFSRPATSWARSRLFASKAVVGIATVAIAIGGAAFCLAVIAIAAGSSTSVLPPHPQGPLAVVLLGQAAIALGEETYYRGLLLGELLRLAPRLGLHAPAARRWVALGLSSLLFGMEHVGNTSGWNDGARQLIFAFALGILLGMIVLATDNLWIAASLHAWINWLLLGAAPRLGYGPAQAGLPPRASVSVALIAAFLAAFALQRRSAQR